MKQNGADQQKLLPLSQCKKVFILRDYSQGLTVKFFTKLPTELQGYVDANYFESFVNELNRIYAEAERTGLESVFETLAGCLTCYLANLCLRTQYEKYLKQIAKYLKEENEKIFLPAGLFVTDPIERGLRIIEISFVDEPASNVVKNAPAPTPLAPAH
uniref:Ras modification protein ERF4 n=1 Tax=Romanomermis culicivorax TaxID=13658 RepID=A0A915JK98_ROMCU